MSTALLALISCIAAAGFFSAASVEPSLRKVATLRTARAAHTATALPSGGVLVVGGMAGGSSIGQVEIFDPAHNAVRAVGTLSVGRSGHTATLLRGGRVIVAGGYNGSYLSSVEEFEPSAERFRAAGSLAEQRSGHTATVLNDGRILYVGGVGSGWTYLRSAELYDPATGRSELVGSLSVPREGHTATLLRDGRVLVVGGHTGRRPNVVVHASAEIFSPATRRFEPAAILHTARHKHDAVRLDDGRVIVIGGADRSDRVHYETTEIFDAARSSFQRGPSMTHRRYKIAGTSVRLPDGSILVTSGARVAERLAFPSLTFREVPGSLPAAYRFAAAASLADGEVVIAGGYSDGNETTNGVWRFGSVR